MAKSALGIVRKYYPKVTEVVDAKKTIKIRVTPQDCKYAKSGSPSACAMARAFKRDYDGAIVSLSTAYLIQGDKAVRYTVPNAVTREIVSFDRSHVFEPGEYSLAKPATALGHRKYPQTPNKKRGYAWQKSRSNHKTAGIREL